MILKKLQLKDFLSHKDTVVEFTPDSKILIDGRSGSGKTAIVEAIIWCLFGKGRLDNRSLVRNGQSTGYVDIHIGNDVHKWIVRRSITNGGSQTLTITHELDGKVLAVPAANLREKQEYIEKEILKCSYDLFTNSVVYPQDSGQNFVKQSAVKRKELLLEIIGAVDFDGYLAKAKNKYALMDRNISELNVKIETNKEHLERSKVRLKQIKEQSGGESIKSILEKRDKCQKEVDELKSMEETHTKKADELNDKVRKETQAREYVKVLRESLRAEVDVSNHEKEIAEIEKTENGSADLLDKINNEKNKLTKSKEVTARRKELKKEISDIEERVQEKEKNAEELRKEIKELKVDKDDICPVTNEICPKVSDIYKKRNGAIQDKLNNIKCDIDELMKKQMAALEEENKLEDVVADSDFIEIMEKKLVEIGKLGVRKATLTAELKSMKDAKEYNADVNKKIEEASKLANGDHSQEAEKANEDLDQVKGSLSDASGDLSELNQKFAVAQTIEGDKKQVEKVVADTKEVVNILTQKVKSLTESQKCVKLVKEAFGANGIKVVVIDAVLPKLERRINEILSELSDFKIKLDTQKDNASNDGKKEGLFITIINGNGEEMDFDGYSGGEKLKIVVSISEALAELQKAEFRIIDELFIGLDDESVSQFGEVLLRLQERFSQVLCISHIQSIKDLFEDSIDVKKQGGVSTCNM